MAQQSMVLSIQKEEEGTNERVRDQRKKDREQLRWKEKKDDDENIYALNENDYLLNLFKWQQIKWQII